MDGWSENKPLSVRSLFEWPNVLLFIGLAFVGGALMGGLRHESNDPMEQIRAIQLGWAMRGVDALHSVDMGKFKKLCLNINASDYDECRLAVGDVIKAVRDKYGVKVPLR